MRKFLSFELVPSCSNITDGSAHTLTSAGVAPSLKFTKTGGARNHTLDIPKLQTSKLLSKKRVLITRQMSSYQQTNKFPI